MCAIQRFRLDSGQCYARRQLESQLRRLSSDAEQREVIRRLDGQRQAAIRLQHLYQLSARPLHDLFKGRKLLANFS